MAQCPLQADNVLGPAVTQGCRANFDFTLLFEESILSILPATLLLFLVPLRATTLQRQGVKVLRTTSLLFKQVSIVLLACAQLAILVGWSLQPLQRTRASVPAAAVSFIASLALLYLSSLEHAKTIRPSSLINLWILVSLLLDLPQARTLWLRPGSRIVPVTFSISLAAKVLILYLEARNKKRSIFPQYRFHAPEALVNLYSQVSLWWINPMFWTGYRSFLSIDSLYDIDEGLSSASAEATFARHWLRQSGESRWGLVWTLAQSVKWSLIGLVIPRLCLSAFKLSQPLLIATITTLLREGLNDGNRNDAKGLIAAAALIYVGVAVTTALYQRHLHRMITKIRASVVSAVYAKITDLDDVHLSDNAALTLVTADTNRICSSLQTIDDLFATPIEIAVAIYLLERQIGVSCVAPVALAVGVSVLSFISSNTAIPMQQAWLAAVSARVAYTSSVLGAPKGFKMLGLTDYFIDTIQALRVHELAEYASYRKYVTWRNIYSAVPQRFAPPLTLMMFVLIEGRQALDPTSAFTALALVALVTAPIQEMIHAVPQLQTALASLDRVQNFLQSHNEGDVSSNAGQHVDLAEDSTAFELFRLPGKAGSGPAQPLMQLIDASVSIAGKTILQPLSMFVMPGALTVIVGPVGSGKSILLKTLVGEMRLSAGTRALESDAAFSYCAQDPWLPNDSIRNIILGQSDHDDRWLDSVIEACALSSDIRSLPAREHTLVGAKGVSLSGGQRQRVALARALYSRKTILVVDDVFSGLDTNTSQQVFARVFGGHGLCKAHSLSVVLATHSQRYLPEADHIIALKEGTVVEQGTFQDLVPIDGYIRSLALTDNPEEEDDPNVTAAKDSVADQAAEPAAVDKITILQQDLARKTGDITVYKYYLQSIGLKFCLILGITIVGFAIGEKAPDLWFRFWSQAEAGGNRSIPLAVWITIAFLFALIFIGSAGTHIWVMLVHAVPKSSAQLHKQLLDAVMHAPYNFFVKTDPGVTLNRFSNDMSIIEGELAGAFM
ncbi:hypothetical protein CKM354_001226500 [Cercospora kikuchii]|uniref:ABC transporter n=1 Tax=Cercospora kikuchii TaxID=84275 RepID=A0A9P3FLP9_9PEZI|nr:uncharacterized protein CKM354_001226500 [Cercospora kikuchii]GIZ49230.1 hypothetical protein CKM354_001226500 [Cercospora kikuchii]